MSEHSHQVSLSHGTSDPQNFVRNFLFGHSSISDDNHHIRSSILMDPRTEGWVGIPHGGIGMGAMMELATMLGNYPRKGDALYPLSADFRMGGSRARIGDRLDVTVGPEKNGATGIIAAGQTSPPYMSASIGYAREEPERRGLFLSYLPESFSDMENKLLPLPHYRNCFVCGVERDHPGLQRGFYLLDINQAGKIVVSLVGFDARDGETFHLFQRNDFFHPVAFLALLDEAMGWAGFMASADGAVTVRIGYTFYRDIRVGERIVFFGRGEKIKGTIGSRLLFWASGGAAVINSDGSLEVVIAAQGQWLGVPELTRQMKRELIPKELTSRAFSLAGT